MKLQLPHFLAFLLFVSLVSSGGPFVSTVTAAPSDIAAETEISAGTPGAPTLAAGDSFGRTCTPIGDLDGDGITDLAVGAHLDDTGGADSNRGAVYVLFMNADGTVRQHSKIAHNTGGFGPLSDDDQFGQSCASPGDVDGDGIPDLAVGARFDDTGSSANPFTGRGALYILFLRADGTVREHTKIAHETGGFGALTDGDLFGGSCASLGDLDGDGIAEVAVGANGDDTEDDPNDNFEGDGRGAVYILFLNADGTVRSQSKIAHNTGGFGTLSDFDGFGTACSLLGDLDGDGFPELAVGAAGDSEGGFDTGAVYVLFLEAGGMVRERRKIAHNLGGFGPLTTKDFFGTSCSALGDLDGDGIPELAVGANGDTDTRGSLYLLFLAADGTVREFTKIAGAELNSGALFVGDEFGTSCAFLGDLDGNGIPEVAVGAKDESVAGSGSGALYLLSLGDPPLVVDTGVDEFDAQSLNGTGVRSLREAVRDAKMAESGAFRRIIFDPLLQSSTLSVTQGPILIDGQRLEISGRSLSAPATISSGGLSRIFQLSSGSALTIECLHLADGSVNSQSGGGILVGNTATLVAKEVEFRNCISNGDAGGAVGSAGVVRVSDCSFIDNEADAGGAIANLFGGGFLQVVNTTFSGNTAVVTNTSAGGGAIFNSGSGGNGFATSKIRFSTFAENSAPQGAGGAIFMDGGDVEVSSSLNAGNTAATGPNDSGPITFSVVQEIPLDQLSALGDFGGKTRTRLPAAGSLAINGGTFTPLPYFDQRGVARSDGMPDIGAVEGALVPPVVAAAQPVFLPDNSAAKAALLKKIKKLKKKLKNARRKGQVAKAKKLKKKIKKLTKKLRAL